MGRTCSGSPHSGYVPPVAPSVSTSRSCPRSRFFARGSAAVTFANPPDSTMSSRDLSGHTTVHSSDPGTLLLTSLAKAEGEHAKLSPTSVSYTHLRAHETKANLVCRLLLEKKKKKKKKATKNLHNQKKQKIYNKKQKSN